MKWQLGDLPPGVYCAGQRKEGWYIDKKQARKPGGRPFMLVNRHQYTNHQWQKRIASPESAICKACSALKPRFA